MHLNEDACTFFSNKNSVPDLGHLNQEPRPQK